MSIAARRSCLWLSILGCFAGGSLYGWSGYLPAVRAQFDISNAAAAMVFSLALACFTFGVLLAPVLLAKLAPRWRLSFLAWMAALSLGVAAMSTGFIWFATAFGVLFGFFSGAIYNHAISSASTSGKATLLVPVSVAAFGLGGAVFGPAQVWLTAAGWGVWSVAPALGCLAVVACASLVVPPAAIPPAEPKLERTTLTRPDKTIAVIWVILAAGSCAGLIVLGFAAQFLPRASSGAGLASLAIFLVALGNTAGRLSATLTVKRFGPELGIAGAVTVSMLALACLMLATAPGMVVALLFCVALAYGQLAASVPLLVKAHVNDAAFSASFGWVFTGWGAAGLLGPWTAGQVLDATGSLQLPLFLCIACSATSLWLVLRLANRRPPRETC